MEEADRQWEVEEEVLLDVLDRVVECLRKDDVTFLIMGGIASSVHGRPRWTHDIDLLVRPEHARQALAALAKGGFRTEEFDPYWLFKAFLDDVLVDVIFRCHGDIFLDDEMLAHSVLAEFRGRSLPLIAPEDLLVIKAVVHAEYSPRHWHDALALIAGCELDWDYLLRRARYGARRTLSLLLYAQSNDLQVPEVVVRDLMAQIIGPETLSQTGPGDGHEGQAR